MFTNAAHAEHLSAQDYRQMYMQLNSEQKRFMSFHHKWCKKLLQALKHDVALQSYYVFLSGLGGVGKSHIIKMVKSDTNKYLKMSRAFDPDEVIVLLTAPTGVAAFNIGGTTLHAAFQLGCNKSHNLKPLTFNNI